MAEAFSENVSNSEDGEYSDSEDKPISILLLTTKWQFDAYGLSTVNKSLVNNLRVVDPEAKKIKITCAVVEEEGKIDQKEEAEKYKVQLRGAKQPRGSKEEPNIKWLDSNTAAYYLDLVRENQFDFIIGHVPYLANGALNFRDIYAATEHKPKVIFMIHDLPRSSDGDTDEDLLLEWLSEADTIFSVGKEVKSELISSVVSLPPEHRPGHDLYIPGYALELFNVRRVAAEGNKLQGTQNITLMTRDRKDLDVDGLDFPLAVVSVCKVSKHILEFDRVKANFMLLTNNNEDKEEWRKEFLELIQKEEFRSRSLNFQLDAPKTFEKMKTHLRKSNLFMLPLKQDFPLFGAEALSAIAAGVPILVSSHSGMASVLEIVSQDESVVRESFTETKEDTWKDRILQKVLRPEDSQRGANKLREELLLDSSIAQTHLDFSRTIAGASCIDIAVELDSNSVVVQEHIARALTFGIHFGSGDTLVDTTKYVLVFIQKLLLQREKLDLGLLTDHLQASTATLWQEVLSTLENSNRKLLGVQSGSLIFALFCPTTNSASEVQNDSWLKTLTQKMERLMKNIGVDTRLRIHPPKDAFETDLLLRFQEMKFNTAQSEGYETMTEVNSDIASGIYLQMFMGHTKVKEWLKQQPDQSMEQETAESSTLSLIEKFTVIKNRTSSLDTRFSITELSGSIGIASAKVKPTLSVMYPGTDKPPLILSRNEYRSAISLTISHKEYLAAASGDKIRLWHSEKGTSSLVYRFEESGLWHLCVIDDRTVACVTDIPSSDNFSKIYTLSTGTKKFTPNSTIWMKAVGTITDISFIKTTDGTPCLLLSSPSIIQCVEMVGGRVQWEVDKQQMSESFHPWSICTDGSTIFVVDPFSATLHLLPADDGSVFTSVNLRPFGLLLPGCVRLQGDNLYVGHTDEKPDTYCISKFTKPTAL